MRNGIVRLQSAMFLAGLLLCSIRIFGQLSVDAVKKDLGSCVKTAIYDFDYTASGWENCDAKATAIAAVTVEPTANLGLTDREKASRGRGVLRLDMDFAKAGWSQSMLCVTLFDSDWSGILAIQYDVFIPDGAPAGLTVTPYFMCDQWKKWVQDDQKTPLVPGKWVTVISYMAALPNIDMAKVTTVGLFLWGTVPAAWKGRVYIDNVVAYSRKPLDQKPKLATVETKKSAGAQIEIDASQYGGEVSRYLLSINFGGTITDPVMQDYLKAIGPGGFFRTWGWPVPGDAFNPAKGQYDWNDGDKIIRSILAAGWEPLVTLGTCPAWMAAKNEKGEPKRNGPPADPKEWARMAADIVRHYNIDLKLGIKYWEIWNEPDIFFWGGTEAEYDQLVKLSSEAMKQVDPSIKILGGAWANCWAPTTPRLKNMLALKPAIDYVSYHNYLTGNVKDTEAAIFGKTAQLMQGPVYKGRKAILSTLKDLGLEKDYPGLDLMMTEMNVCPDTVYDSRVETVMYPVWWAAAYYNYIHRNLFASVYFEYGSRVWGLVNKAPRPAYYLFGLLRKQAGIDGAKWVKVAGETGDLKVLGLKRDDQFSVVIINDTQTNAKYKVDLAFKNLAGVKEFGVYRISDTENGDRQVATIRYADKISVDCAPYTVTVLKGSISAGTPAVAMTKFEEEPPMEALGFSSSGQYSFSGDKAEFTRGAGPVKIDGDLKEFKACRPVLIDGSRMTVGTKADWKGPADAGAKISLMYDKDNLYFGVEVKDDKIVYSKEWPWAGDSIELFLGTHYLHLSRSEKGDYDYQILLAADGAKFKPGKPVIWFLGGTGGGSRDKEAKDSAIAVKKTPTGYVLEAKIGRSNFYEVEGFVPGQDLRFDIGIDDADDAAKGRKLQLMWNAQDQSVWNAPDLWGMAALK